MWFGQSDSINRQSNGGCVTDTHTAVSTDTGPTPSTVNTLQLQHWTQLNNNRIIVESKRDNIK